MKPSNHQSFPWRLFLCELSGTAVLVLVGLSFVIGMFGDGSTMSIKKKPANAKPQGTT